MECFYRDGDHSYWGGCKENAKAEGGYSGIDRLTGVTTVVAPWDWTPDPLMKWAVRLSLEGVAKAFGWKQTDEGLQPTRPVPPDPQELGRLLYVLGLTWEQVRDAKGTTGTNVHEDIFHALCRGETPNLDDVPQADRGKAQGVMKWWLDRQPEPMYAERVVMSKQHRIAGRLDFYGSLTKKLTHEMAPPPGAGVVDLKTGFIPLKALAQVSGYDLALQETGLAPASDFKLIVQVTESGSYREVWVDSTVDDFLLSLAMYRRAADLRKALRN